MIVLVAAAALRAAPATAQDGLDLFQEELRVKLDEQRPEDRDVAFDAGGWISAVFYHYDDAAARSDRTLRRYQLRVWGRMNVKGVHRAYVRGLLNYDDWNKGDNPMPGRGDESEEEIERLWYELDIGTAVWGSDNKLKVKIKAGRQFAQIGTALTLSMPLDMVQVAASTPDLSVKALLGLTIRDSDNIDQSANVASHQDRLFCGVELAYEGFGRHRPFVYVLSNKDNTDPRPNLPGQSFEYSSQYVGVGSKGMLPGGELKYQAEVVSESGRTYSVGATTGKDRISAVAVDLAVNYNFRMATKPRLMAEYIFASGDKNRAISSTSTIGGNVAGSKDHAFNAFGFRDTGLALAPRISNIQICMLGGSFFPLEDIKAFRKMEIGTKLFYYRKVAEAGAISDTTALNNSRYVGSAADVFCDWRMTSDLAFTIRYGAFFPGSAYDGGDKTCRQFLYSGLVFSF